MGTQGWGELRVRVRVLDSQGDGVCLLRVYVCVPVVCVCMCVYALCVCAHVCESMRGLIWACV